MTKKKYSFYLFSNQYLSGELNSYSGTSTF